MANYFNTLSLSQKLEQLSKCRFMESSEFEDGVSTLIGKKIVIVGCGAQGLNQGLNLEEITKAITFNTQFICQSLIDVQNAIIRSHNDNVFLDELID